MHNSMLWRKRLSSAAMTNLCFAVLLIIAGLPDLIGNHAVAGKLVNLTKSRVAVAPKPGPRIPNRPKVTGVLTLLGYLISDICYSIADPRVSYD